MGFASHNTSPLTNFHFDYFQAYLFHTVVAGDLNVRVHTLRCAQTLSNAPKHPPAIHSSGPVGQGRGPDYNLIYWAKL